TCYNTSVSQHTITIMSIAGTYVHSSNELYSEWLTALGVPADSLAKLVAAKPTLEVSQSGNQIVVKTTAGDKNFTNTIKLGEDSKAELPGGIEYTVNMTKSGSSLEGTWTMGGKTGKATVTFTDSGVTQTMALGDVTAKRVYTRQ
ncbi:hypothetical protein CGJ15_25850, partial [Vibrio parahaemolyticus]